MPAVFIYLCLIIRLKTMKILFFVFKNVRETRTSYVVLMQLQATVEKCNVRRFVQLSRKSIVKNFYKVGRNCRSGAGEILWLSSIRIPSFPEAVCLRSRSELIGLLRRASSQRALPQQLSILCPFIESFQSIRLATAMRSSETLNLNHCSCILCHYFSHSGSQETGNIRRYPQSSLYLIDWMQGYTSLETPPQTLRNKYYFSASEPGLITIRNGKKWSLKENINYNPIL